MCDAALDQRLREQLDASVAAAEAITPPFAQAIVTPLGRTQLDAVIAALPEWRAKIEEMAKKAPGRKVGEVKLLAPVARPSKVMAAWVNYRAHFAEMAKMPHVTRNVKLLDGLGSQGIFQGSP